MSSPSAGAPDLDGAAELLFTAYQSETLFAGFPDELRPRTELEAYQVQERLIDLLVRSEDDGRAGHKIGSTTPVMQAYLGIASPCAGVLRTSMARREHGRFEHRGPAVLGVECELAVRLGTDLPPRGAAYERADVATAVAACMAAIEVVEDRYVDWRSLDTPTLIADNFFQTGVVTGPEYTDFDPEELDRVTASMTIDGEVVGRGTGTDVLGHPLTALLWLANNASGRGVTLRRGEIVMLGSLVETNWVKPGSTVRIDNSLLGSADALFV